MGFLKDNEGKLKTVPLLLVGSAVGLALWRLLKPKAEESPPVAETDPNAALKEKARTTPLSLSAQELQTLSAVDGVLLGEILNSVTQEDAARMRALAQGQAYATPDAPTIGEPSTIGPG